MYEKEASIDKRLKLYLDHHFKDGKWIKTTTNDGSVWFGFVKNDGWMIVGKPASSGSEHYFYDGSYFVSDVESLLGITTKEFNEGMARYLNNKYDLNITSIF